MLWLLLACKADEETPETTFDAELGAALDAAFTEAFDGVGAPGAAMAVHVPGEGTWTAARGFADPNEQVEAEPDALYKIASITKTWTATVTMQLVDEGTIELDDPLSAWFADDLTPWSDITVRQLLGHTSGIADHAFAGDFLDGLGEERTIREIVAAVEDEPLAFAPGTDHSYSNTNYFVLALILEAQTGVPYGQLVRERILDPHGLDRCFVPSVDGVPDDVVPGWFGAPGNWTEPDPIHWSSEGAGGEMICTSTDLVRFGQLLFVKQSLTSTDSLDAMTTEVVPGAGYGLGVYLADAPDGGRLLGHSGSTVSAQSRLNVHEDSGIVVVSLVNSFLAEADVLDSAAWDVLAGAR